MRFRVLTHPALADWTYLEATADSGKTLFAGDLTRADALDLQKALNKALGSRRKSA